MPPITKTFTAGSFLFRENDQSKEMYIIHSGSIRVFRKDGEKNVELVTLGKGAVLGEMAMIDGRARSASAQVVEVSEVSIVSPDDFFEKTKSIPGWFFTLIKITINRLRNSNTRLHTAMNQNLAGNIATLLHLVNKRHSQEFEGRKVLDLKFAKKEIGTILGIDLDDLNRAVDELEETGMIAVEKNKIHIPDDDQLSRYGRYLRIRPSVEGDKDVRLTGASRRFLVFLHQHRSKYGKPSGEGVVFALRDFADDIQHMLGDSRKEVLEELTERGFCSLEGDEKTGSDDATIVLDSHRLEEFALLEEFEGDPTAA